MHSEHQDFTSGWSSHADPDSRTPERDAEDIVVAEVIDEVPGDEGNAGGRSEDGQLEPAREPAVITREATPVSGGTDNGQPWHEIQAEFVDDPYGAVRRAVEAADAAITALAADLRRQLPDLTASGGDGSSQDTEQLRIAVQRCRELWQGANDLGASSQPAVR
jgi:hypothetical protein